MGNAVFKWCVDPSATLKFGKAAESTMTAPLGNTKFDDMIACFKFKTAIQLPVLH